MRRFLTAAAGIVLAVPFVASAYSANDISSQVASLLAQITDLQARILQMRALGTSTPIAITVSAATSSAAQQVIFSTTVGSTTPAIPAATPGAAQPALSCTALTRNLSRGASGADVRSLQSFLISQGLLLPNSASGFFGTLTEGALQQWQASHSIVSSGSAASTGFGAVGPRTLAAINTACTGASATRMSGSISASSLAPRQVSVTITANSARACGVATYTLKYGDGASEAILVPASACDEITRTFTHLYAAAGTYTLSLVSGGKSTSVTQTVADACASPQFSIDSDVSSSIQQNMHARLMYDAGSTTLSAQGLPSGLALAKERVGTSTEWMLVGVPQWGGVYAITLTAQNACATTRIGLTLPVASTTIASNGCALAPRCAQ